MQGLFSPTRRTRLSEPMLAVLEHGFGYHAPTMKHTVWLCSRFWLPKGVNAITLGARVYYTAETRDLVGTREWFGLVVHEMTHRQQIYRASTLGFYGSYLLQSIKGYARIHYEQAAYYAQAQAVGGERMGQRALGIPLWEYRLPQVANHQCVGDILQNDGSELQKTEALTQLCTSWRAGHAI